MLDSLKYTFLNKVNDFIHVIKLKDYMRGTVKKGEERYQDPDLIKTLQNKENPEEMSIRPFEIESVGVTYKFGVTFNID